jgi:putative serine protease PepD
VIGVNDQILNAGDTNDNAGVGFSVPINKSKAVAQTLIAGGTVQHAYVGVLIQTVDGGAKVTKINAGSPADKSELKVGDVITAFDGHKVTSANDLTAAVSAAKVGEKVTVTVKRDGSTQQIPITLGVQPATATS